LTELAELHRGVENRRQNWRDALRRSPNSPTAS
jgi:hypothetical protein